MSVPDGSGAPPPPGACAPLGTCAPAEITGAAPARWLPAGTGLVLAAIVVVSLTLRSPIAAVSPVLGDLRADLGLGPGAAGLLTTLPVLCFALASTAVLALYRRVGAEHAVVLSMLVLALGTLLRSAPGGSPVPAMVGTVVIGLAITVGNVVVPVVAKRDFGDRSPAVVGLYTAALTGGAALAAAGTAPVADVVGWRTGLASWVLLVVAAAVLWLLVLRRHRRAGGPPPAPTSGARLPLRRNGTAWALTVLFGTQSALYYSMTAWLPSMLGSRPDEGGISLDRAEAGVALSLMQVIGIVGSLLVPALVAWAARRGHDQRVLGVAVGAAWLVPVLGLLAVPQWWPVWVVVIGVGQGAGISLGFALMVLRAADDHVAAGLSGFVQTGGYLLAAGTPVLVGVAYDLSGGWQVPLVLMAVMAAVLGASGLVAGARRTVG